MKTFYKKTKIAVDRAFDCAKFDDIKALAKFCYDQKLDGLSDLEVIISHEMSEKIFISVYCEEHGRLATACEDDFIVFFDGKFRAVRRTEMIVERELMERHPSEDIRISRRESQWYWKKRTKVTLFDHTLSGGNLKGLSKMAKESGWDVLIEHCDQRGAHIVMKKSPMSFFPVMAGAFICFCETGRHKVDMYIEHDLEGLELIEVE